MKLPTALLGLAAAALLAAGCGGENGEASGTAEAAEAPPTTKASGSGQRTGARVKVVGSDYGRVLADRRGEAFYVFDKETTRRSRCYGACATAWPPVLAKGRPQAGRGASRRLLGTTRRRNGKLQVTYAGRPLYYYVADSPGTILCHDVAEFGGLWQVVAPDGQPVD
jgi:predicted lipoprotein with Yx(FWY)xxD motif